MKKLNKLLKSKPGCKPFYKVLLPMLCVVYALCSITFPGCASVGRVEAQRNPTIIQINPNPKIAPLGAMSIYFHI